MGSYSDNMFGVLARIRIERLGEERRRRTRNNAACAIYNSIMVQKTVHSRSQMAYTRNAQNTADVWSSVCVDRGPGDDVRPIQSL